jgi:hypothetical protein
MNFIFRTEHVGKWTLPTVAFESEDDSIAFEVKGIIGNSVPSPGLGRKKLTRWKQLVAKAAKKARGDVPFKPSWIYCISAGFSFNLQEHGGGKLDVENFLKPTFDALAAGLFCTVNQDPERIERYNYDDSNFRYLFVYRLDDAPRVMDEGVGFVLSIKMT